MILPDHPKTAGPSKILQNKKTRARQFASFILFETEAASLFQKKI
jgi:hypothetical protein